MNLLTPVDPVAVDPSEQLSALADGQLQGEDLAQTLAACEQDPALLDAWRDYHLIGDVLRGSAVGLPPASKQAYFLQRLQTRLAPAAPVAPPASPVPVVQERVDETKVEHPGGPAQRYLDGKSPTSNAPAICRYP